MTTTGDGAAMARLAAPAEAIRRSGAVEHLEERSAGLGCIGARVLAILRERAANRG